MEEWVPLRVTFQPPPPVHTYLSHSMTTQTIDCAHGIPDGFIRFFFALCILRRSTTRLESLSVNWQFTYETQCLFGSIVSTSKERVQETKQSKLLTYLPSARRSPPLRGYKCSASAVGLYIQWLRLNLAAAVDRRSSKHGLKRLNGADNSWRICWMSLLFSYEETTLRSMKGLSLRCWTKECRAVKLNLYACLSSQNHFHTLYKSNYSEVWVQGHIPFRTLQ